MEVPNPAAETIRESFIGDPGICELTVQVVHAGEVVATATTLFLISSAAVDVRGLGSLSPPDPDSEWKAAVAFGSDDWGRTADMIPIFPHHGELDRTEKEGWDPGSWGRATVETAADVEVCPFANVPRLAAAPIVQEIV